MGVPEGSQEATFKSLHLDKQREAQRGEGATLKSQSRKAWPLRSYFSDQGGGPRIQERVLSISPPTVLSKIGKRGPERDTVYRDTHREPRDWKRGRRRPGRWDQTKDARRRRERSRAVGPGVEPGWG